MRLPLILKIVFTVFHALWVVVLFLSMPPEGMLETILVLAGAALIFVAAYFFYLFLIRAHRAGGVEKVRKTRIGKVRLARTVGCPLPTRN